jgi:mannose/fructose/N-acetylgalactosamine-specific phosphotransferase system component IIC
MLSEMIAVAILGGIIAWDRGSFLTLVSEPVFICLIYGAWAGNYETGLLMGLIWQAIWMSELQVGAARIPNGSVGALVSTALCLKLNPLFPQSGNLVFTASLFSGVVSAYLGGQFNSMVKKLNRFFLRYVDLYAVKGAMAKLENLMILGVLLQFLAGAFISLVLYMLFFHLAKPILAGTPKYWDELFQFLPAAFWGISAGCLLALSWKRKAWGAVILGIVMGLLILR